MASPVVWVRCDDTWYLPAIQDLSDGLKQDGDLVDFRITTNAGGGGFDLHPVGKRAVRGFLASQHPVLTLFLGGSVDTGTLAVCQAQNQTVVCVDSAPPRVRATPWGAFGIGKQPAMAGIAAVFDQQAKHLDQFKRHGVAADRLYHAGPWDKAPMIGPVPEQPMQSIHAALQGRPLWYVRGAHLSDIDLLSAVQFQISRQSHRLMMTVSAEVPGDGPKLARALAETGLITRQSGGDDMPDETCQAFVCNTPRGEDIWMRLSPITLAIGSLDREAGFDPFEPTAMGSVVIHGRKTGRFAGRFARLQASGASVQLDAREHLGPAVMSLLAPDRTATMGLAGWQVISAGADITEGLARVVQAQLDRGRV